MKKIHTFFFLFTFSVLVSGQQINFEKKIGKSATADMGYSVAETYDNGYIISGLTGGIGFGQEDVYLVRTDSSGDTLWTKTFGTPDFGEFSRYVIQTADSGFAVLGYTESYGSGAADIFLIKTKKNGDTSWTKTYGGQYNDDGLSVRQTFDGGYIIAGTTYSFGSGDADIYLIKTNEDGDTSWTRTFGGLYEDNGISVSQTPDNGYIITGYSKSFAIDFMDLLLIKTDSAGIIQWNKTYDGPETGSSSGDYGSSVEPTFDGGYIIAGTRGYIDGTGFTGLIWLIKTNAAGDTLWTKSFGQVGIDDANGKEVRECSDSGFAIAGTRYTYGAGLDIYLIRTDDNGDTIWTKTIDGGNDDKGFGLFINHDNSFIISGYAYTFTDWYQVYLVKVMDTTSVNSISDIVNEIIDIIIYPNPFAEYATIELLSSKEENYFLNIFSSNGKIILKTDNNKGNKIKIERKSLGAGMYFFQLSNNKYMIKTGKLIIR